MLVDIKCSAIVSLKIDLTYDDSRANKSEVVSVGDLIDVDFNYNGCRVNNVEGRVLKIYAEGSDPKKWYILLDSADPFESKTYKFSPMNILDLTVIQRESATQYIYSTNDYTNIKGMREVKGTLQYTKDGVNWIPFHIYPEYIIEDESYGTRPKPPIPIPGSSPDDVITDE